MASRTFHTELWLVALASAAVCLLFRRENVAVAALLAGLSLYPFKVMLVKGGTEYRLDDYTNTVRLNEVRYVLQTLAWTAGRASGFFVHMHGITGIYPRKYGR